MNKQIQQTPPKIVAIAFGYIPHYRKEFYYGLKEALDKKNIILKVIYGQPNKRDMLKGDMVEIPWGIRIENKILQIGDKELYWQPILPYIKDADLVIVEPGSRLLVNYLLLLRSIFGNPKLAFWGFGVHFHKSKAIPISEWVKRFITKKVHWYFAYTERVVDIVSEMGYPKERITVVYNSIDTRNLIKTRNRVTNKELADLKSRLSVKGNHIGLYIGAMYKEKKLKFLIESCKLIRQQVHDFEMLMIGAGTDAYLVRDAVSENPWIHYLGPKFNEEKVPFFAISKLFLLPGSVGLAVLDSFSLGVPIITTKNPDQAPELDYLIDGKNGVIINDDVTPAHYAQVVSDLITNNDRLNALVEGCRVSALKYTVEKMVTNFADGVVKALNN